MANFYEVLEIAPEADDAAIKAAYRKLAMKYHPDKNPNDPKAEAKFKEINEAHDTLKDPQKRAAYDYENRAPKTNNFSWGGGPSPRGGFHPGGFGANIDIEEIIRDMNRNAGPGWAQPPKNRDIVLNYSITLEESFAGKEAELTYNLPGKPSQDIKFKIPKGFQDGMKLRFAGKGDNTIAEVAAGDLYIQITVIPHMSFERMGFHLATSIQIDYLDAMLGTEVEIPTIEGGKIKMRVPAGIFPGQSLRATGKGMAIADNQRGDMLVEVVIAPSKLSDEQRELIEQARGKRNT